MKNNKSCFSIALFCAVLMLGGLTSTSWAQSQTFEAGWSKATDLLDGILTPEQHAELNILAFSTAVAGLCDGFSLDKDKFGKGMETLKHESEADMSAEEMAYFEKHLTFSYGVAVGLSLAEGSMDQSGFCAAATEHRNDPEAHLHYWE